MNRMFDLIDATGSGDKRDPRMRNVEAEMIRSHVEKPREFDPRGQATMTPAGKNTLTPYGKIKMTPENDCFSGAFL